MKGAGWNRRRLARIFNIHLLISPEGRKTCSPRFQLIKNGMLDDAGETPAIPGTGLPAGLEAHGKPARHQALSVNRTYTTHMSYGVYAAGVTPHAPRVMP